MILFMGIELIQLMEGLIMSRLNMSTKYYLTGLLVIIIIPVIIIALYEWLAGGVFNGLAGSWRQPIINPDIFLLFVNPVLLLMGYALLVHFFHEHKRESRNAFSRALSWLVFIVATVTVIVGVSWKVLTT